ncbi:hypothetical protein SLEP1_g15033 [Rubroshorea leprosula]|uniref:Uncharacterized protein n=1 Tax=Rubroshorea leprosula TaxID=152421 RepID=A0AAV5IL28_9ROSI|nr:hypothetical protein SLEP1_g15033 [Rubroshorea leprosula]
MGGGRPRHGEEGCMQPYTDRSRSEKHCRWAPESNQLRDSLTQFSDRYRLVHLWDPSHECTASVASRNWVLGRDRFSGFVLDLASQWIVDPW